MTPKYVKPPTLWSSPLRFALVGFGALTGMDTFSEFPYLLTRYGGGRFVAIYIAFLLLIAWPLLAAQLKLGRHGRDGGTRPWLHGSRAWRWTWIAALAGGFLMFCYVALISGWMLAYAHAALVGNFRHASLERVAGEFAHLARHPLTALLWDGLFIAAVSVIVGAGPAAIEDLARFVVPGLAALFAGLVAYAATFGSFFVSAPVLLGWQPAAGQASTSLVALSQVFFGAGLGTAAWVAYGAYLPSSVAIGRTTLILVLAQAVAAWLAGFALASLAFAAGLSPLAGGGFLFETLPLVSARLPWGPIAVALCYLGLVSAAWLSTVAWLEPFAQFLRVARVRAALGLGLAAWVVGAVLTLSLNSWAFSFTFLGRVKTLGLLDILMILAVNVLLPWGGGGLSLLMGWDRAGVTGESGYRGRAQRVWLWALRIVVPSAVVIVFFGAPRLIL